MIYTLEEQETYLAYDVLNQTWRISTSYKPHIKRLTKVGLDKDPSAKIEYEDDEKQTISSIEVNIDLDKFNIKPFPKKKRVLTAEEKQKLIDQLHGKKANEK